MWVNGLPSYVIRNGCHRYIIAIMCNFCPSGQEINKCRIVIDPPPPLHGFDTINSALLTTYSFVKIHQDHEKKSKF